MFSAFFTVENALLGLYPVWGGDNSDVTRGTALPSEWLCALRVHNGHRSRRY